MLNGIIKENPVLVLILGTCPTLATTNTVNRAFGMGIAAVASTLDPDVFTIGGGVSGEGPVLLGGIRESYRRYAFHASTETEFRLAALGNDAGMIGAAVPFYM